MNQVKANVNTMVDFDKVNKALNTINKWVEYSPEVLPFDRVLNDVTVAQGLSNNEVSFIRYIAGKEVIHDTRRCYERIFGQGSQDKPISPLGEETLSEQQDNKITRAVAIKPVLEYSR